MSIPNHPGDASADVNVPMALTFNVTVNAQARTLPAASTLADLMALIDAINAINANGSAENAPQVRTAAATATAVNGEFVPIGRRAGHILRDGDQITCFQLIVGG